MPATLSESLVGAAVMRMVYVHVAGGGVDGKSWPGTRRSAQAEGVATRACQRCCACAGKKVVAVLLLMCSNVTLLTRHFGSRPTSMHLSGSQAQAQLCDVSAADVQVQQARLNRV